MTIGFRGLMQVSCFSYQVLRYGKLTWAETIEASDLWVLRYTYMSEWIYECFMDGCDVGGCVSCRKVEAEFWSVSVISSPATHSSVVMADLGILHRDKCSMSLHLILSIYFIIVYHSLVILPQVCILNILVPSSHFYNIRVPALPHLHFYLHDWTTTGWRITGPACFICSYLLNMTNLL